jgi:hypothetical protein
VGRFTDAPNNICSGIFLNACTGFTITDNNFNGTIGHIGHSSTQIGITINNSGAAYNVIDNNYFNSLDIGTLAQNNNRSEVTDFGLKILCNTYSLNEYDISVTGNGCVACGIALFQGTRTNPAGNLFSRMDTQGFYDYYNELSFIYYFHHYVENYDVPPDWYPKNSSSILSIGKEDTGIPWNENYCLNQIIETADKTIVKDLYLSSTVISDSLKVSLTELIDGGNTDALEMEITFAQPEEALDLQEELLDNSPYLSDTILIKSAEKEDVLAPVMVKEIMVANPQSAKSEKVMEALENRENPIPEYMMQEIMEGRNSLAQKEILEAELSEAEFQNEIALNKLISIFREDTISARLDSIINLLRNHNTLSASYQLVMTCLEKNDTLSALNMLDSIPDKFDLTSNQALIHGHWIEWVDIINELNTDSINLIALDTNMIERMNALSQFEDQPAYLAKNTLHFLGIMETGPYYVQPGEQLKSVESKPGSQIGSASFLTPYIKLYPNPAKNYLVVEYNVPDISVEGLLNIYTATGKTQFMNRLYGNQHDFIINTKDWLDGIYFFNFTTGTDYKQSGKLIIAR